MYNIKSPGQDWLIVEFYKMYWPDIKNDFYDVISAGLEDNQLAYSQYLAVIALLYKKGNRLDIKNWRPISLLNVDFKIASKSLAERLKTILPDIIHTDQKGCIKGRFIGESIRLIEDILQETDDEAVVLLIDQEKAFDRVEWPWLFKVLHRFNFGERFISWISTLYCNAKTSIMTNRYQSHYFEITRGIRQGDAMSALLYIIQSEPLAGRLRNSFDIKGIEIKVDGNSEETRLWMIPMSF